jgi:hypothetical protein
LTISASDRFGLPTAMDDEVILGLVQLSKAANFKSPTVPFSRYQLISLLGWRDEGKSYKRVEESLKRWLGVTLYYENAWWDKRDNKWVDAHFHLLESVILHHGSRRFRRESGESPRSTFTWNSMVFQSFQAGYLKQIDMEIYRSLKLATTKRMFRFLDKKFHFGKMLRFDLGRFAYEHIGLSRSYDAAQLKRRLVPAIQELEGVGFLEPLDKQKRFSRLHRGCWEVVFRKQLQSKPKKAAHNQLSPLEEKLIERGVNELTAIRLVKDYPADSIQEKIETFDRLVSAGDVRVSKNPAGYLVQSIRDDYVIRDGGKPKVTRQQKIHHRASVANRPETLQKTENFPRIQEYLNRLSPDNVRRLEEEALKTSPRLLADGYRRAKTSGNSLQLEGYRQAILERHLLPLLENPA